MLPTSAARAEVVDTGAVYERNRQQLIGVVRGATDRERETTVLATPAWRVRDVLAHVVGITADLNALDFGPGDADAWTARQVERRRDRSIEELLDEWDREAPTFEDGLRLLGYSLGAHYVGDLFTHLQDVRTTLRLGRSEDAEAVLVALDFYLEDLDESLRSRGAAAVEIVAGDERHLAGDGPPAATLRGSAFDVLRCLSGRRSPGQIAALDWTGDRDRVASELSRYPLPEVDLPD